MMSLLSIAVPEQRTGHQTTTQTRITLANTADAVAHFALVRERLLNVNAWHSFAGKGTAEFQLFDGKGNKVNRPVREGDYFQIDIPGPGSTTGKGKDWVRVVRLNKRAEGDEEIVYFRVRTSDDPLSLSKETAHFFAESATSTFVVYRFGKQVMAAVFGRNEKANTGTRGLYDRIRNALFAVGAWVGLSKMQWKALTRGLIRRGE